MPRNVGHALLLWIGFVFVFLAFGGVGAGVTTLLFERIIGDEVSDVLYAVFFASHGLIAYRLSEALLVRRSSV